MRDLDAKLQQQRLQYLRAVAARSDEWVAACGGNETDFTYGGTRWLYVFNPAKQQHGWLNLDTDVVHDYYMADTDYRVEG